ncbi:MAG: B12-binding domain-containing radical SAM protein [Elusimicrobia bacterium]|nr:B12-binding domain-containing radical SAM protein [Candidatus Obscuribacterium magneticum]
MKVLLLEAFAPDESRWGSFSVEKGFVLPLGMLAIYSYLKSKGIDVQLIDTQFGQFTRQHLQTILADKEIGIVGIPVFTNSAHHSFQTAALCKEIRPDIVVVLGGVHVTILPERTLMECPAVDYVIMGEGEYTFYELVTSLSSKKPINGLAGVAYRDGDKIIVNPHRPFISNLDELPMTCYEGLDLSKYIPHPTQYIVLPNQALVTQRGCPYPCVFCEASAVLGKVARRFSPERVMAELDLLVKKYGTRGIYFQDSTFSINRDYTMKLMELLIKSDLDIKWACNNRADKVDKELLTAMKRAGCWMINYGVESGNQASLEVLKKCMTVEDNEKAVELTKKTGIDVLCNFIIAIPGEDEAMVKNTIRYAKKLLPDLALFYLPTPFPTSPLYDICKKSGGIRENVTWEDYLLVDYDNPVYVNPLLGKDKMKAYYKKAYRDFYLNPRYLLQAVAKLRSPTNLKRLWRGLRALRHFLDA